MKAVVKVAVSIAEDALRSLERLRRRQRRTRSAVVTEAIRACVRAQTADEADDPRGA